LFFGDSDRLRLAQRSEQGRHYSFKLKATAKSTQQNQPAFASFDFAIGLKQQRLHGLRGFAWYGSEEKFG
jgi:hypothetical protein